jgi:hypothetical protein
MYARYKASMQGAQNILIDQLFVNISGCAVMMKPVLLTADLSRILTKYPMYLSSYVPIR